jgi:hypothetical protein
MQQIQIDKIITSINSKIDEIIGSTYLQLVFDLAKENQWENANNCLRIGLHFSSTDYYLKYHLNKYRKSANIKWNILEGDMLEHNSELIIKAYILTLIHKRSDLAIHNINDYLTLVHSQSSITHDGVPSLVDDGNDSYTDYLQGMIMELEGQRNDALIF